MKSKVDWYLSYGDYLVCNRKLIGHIGPSAAIMLGELIAWESRLLEMDKISEGGSFYMNQDLIKDRIGFSQEKQTSCIKKLQDLEIIRFERRGIPYRNHYIINREKIEGIIEDIDRDQRSIPNDRNQRLMLAADSGQSLYIENEVSNNKESKIQKELRSFSLIDSFVSNKTAVGNGFNIGVPLKRRVNKNPIEFENSPRYRYPKDVVDIITYWNNSPGLSHHRTPFNDGSEPTKTFESIVKMIRSILKNGEYFTSVGLTKYARPYTKEEVIAVIDRFKLMATNLSYLPTKKDTINKTGLNTFFHNSYANGVPSYFIKCLEEEPKHVASNAKAKEDKNPSMTKLLKSTYVDRVLLGEEKNFNQLEENKFIDGAEKLQKFIKRIQPRINMMTDLTQWVELFVFSLVEKWGASQLYPGHLCADHSFNDVFVRHLKNKGRID